MSVCMFKPGRFVVIPVRHMVTNSPLFALRPALQPSSHSQPTTHRFRKVWIGGLPDGPRDVEKNKTHGILHQGEPSLGSLLVVYSLREEGPGARAQTTAILIRCTLTGSEHVA